MIPSGGTGLLPLEREGECMDIGELIKLCRRRWLVLTCALVIVAIATVAAFITVPTKYESQAQLTMLNSQKITNQQGDLGNPYLAFSQTLSVDVDFLTRYLVSDDAVKQLASRGVTEQFTAAFADNALGPFMQLTVTGTNRAHTLQSTQTLISFAQERWSALQTASSAPSSTLVALAPIAPPSTPTPVLKSKIELVGGVAIIGIVGSFLLAVIVDRSRSERRPPPRKRPPPRRMPPARDPNRARQATPTR